MKAPPLKLALLAALVLVLLLPVARVTSLVRERQARGAEVRREIASSWGEAQALIGPVLTVPIRLGPIPAKEGPIYRRDLLHLLPEDLRWQGTLAPHELYRGIFEVIVYEGSLRAEGSFRLPRATDLPDGVFAVDWDQAALALGLSDSRGIQERLALRWAGSPLAFLPGTGDAGFLEQGVHAPLPALAPAGDAIPFLLEVDLRGTESLSLAPLGQLTRVDLASTWPDPSFGGAFLPDRRRIGEDGFAASWAVPWFGRSFPQQWRRGEHLDEEVRRTLLGAAFGVSLARPANGYLQTERSVKYAALFLVLTFTTCFLFELLSPVRLHPLQYLLVGAALCLFYLLLLALSEHFGFAAAYLAASFAIVTLVAGYARSVLASRRRAAVLGACLSALYGYLFALLRAQDYALILGTIGLFAALAAVMFLTRRLDWYTLRFAGEEPQRPPPPSAPAAAVPRL
ncbi:MAG TPA: cell envelope integrity protein CreD [Thermoanaerobaculia bacterium]|nr:cell envelope integrity protein CreD [Thermoanaerobaculia bacterium]